MVFYEHYILLSHRGLTRNALATFVNDCSKVVTSNQQGYLLRVKDLGWRRTAYRVGKPKGTDGGGVFHFGRWVYLSYGCATDVPPKIQNFVNHSPSVLRSVLLKMKPKTMLPPT